MSEYKPIEACTSVAELLADPARWTKDYSAVDDRGFMVEPDDEVACAFCICGAIQRVYGHDGYDANYEKIRKSLSAPGRRLVATFNDAPERTHAEVLEAVRRAGI